MRAHGERSLAGKNIVYNFYDVPWMEEAEHTQRRLYSNSSGTDHLRDHLALSSTAQHPRLNCFFLLQATINMLDSTTMHQGPGESRFSSDNTGLRLPTEVPIQQNAYHTILPHNVLDIALLRH